MGSLGACMTKKKFVTVVLEDGREINIPPAQYEIARYLADGLTYDEIAAERKCSASTVRTHVHGLFQKLEVTKVSQAITRLYALGVFQGGKAIAPVIHINGEPDPGEGPCSPAQKLYLAAFERHLYAHRGGEARIHKTRLEMDYALGAMYMEAGVSMDSHDARRQVKCDGLDLIDSLRTIERRRAA